ncbi:MAG: hypothetical protein ABF633_09365 [Clostridium sp.]|uniref:hypothetical protein n=1 Tax=Clostridium sp. TaxID=1506 RepID=UPI0039E737BC
MNLRHFIGPLGILTAIGFIFALLNFFVKLINKNYILKLPKDKNHFVTYYKKIMKFIVKNHKTAGIITFILMLLHFFIAYNSHRIKITGIIAAIIMAAVVILGIYGKSIKRPRGKWLTIHRSLAFILIIAIIFHIL